MLPSAEVIGRFLWIPLYVLLALKTEALDFLMYHANRDSLVGSTQTVSDAPGTWESAASLPSYRYEFGGTALGDDVYVVGGVFLPSVYTGTGQMEVYHTKTDTWEDAPALPIVINHTAVVSDGTYLYVIGGNMLRSQTTNHVYRYNPREKVWKRLADMPTSRGAHGAGIIGGKIYVAGGAIPGKTFATLEIYDIATDSWKSGPPMPTAREHVAAAVAGDTFHVLGGYPKDRFHAAAVHEVYDPKTNAWETKASMSLAVAGFSAVGLNNRLFFFGGEQGWAVSPEVHEYRPEDDTWVRRADMPKGRYAHIAVPLQGKIHVIGGNEKLGGYQFSHRHDVFTP